MFQWEMFCMRDFTWQFFSKTGDLDAYLLYKQVSEDIRMEPEGLMEEQEIEDLLGGING
jgi:hypothetical protein